MRAVLGVINGRCSLWKASNREGRGVEDGHPVVLAHLELEDRRQEGLQFGKFGV
jgi:hypothetical protein